MIINSDRMDIQDQKQELRNAGPPYSHIRTNCPNVQCNHCHKGGHFRYKFYDAQPEGRTQNKQYVAMLDDEYEADTKVDDPNDYAPSRGEVIGR